MIPELGGDLIQWLRGFYYTVQTGSMSAASAKMRRNQPTLSYQIKCLEEFFGITLFDRSKGKQQLTPDGEYLLEKAISMFEIIQECQDTFTNASQNLKGEINIYTYHTVLKYFLSSTAAEFYQAHPAIQFRLGVNSTSQIIQRVESAECDFGIACTDDIKKDLDCEHLFSAKLFLIAPPDGPFAISELPDLKAISQMPFLAFSQRGGSLMKLINNRFEQEDLKLNIVLELNHMELIKNFTSAGFGVSIVDEFALSEEDKNILRAFPITHYFPARHFGIVRRKNAYTSPQVRAFIRLLKDKVETFKERLS